MKVGIDVRCETCSQSKQPVGRSAPMEARYCNSDCKGYYQPPYPGNLWPGETEEEFGYPVGRNGTREQ